VTDQPDIVVVEESVIETVSVDDEVQVIEKIVLEAIEVGTKGDKGDKGDQGDQGDPGIQGPPGTPASGTFSYVHDQMIPSATWTVVHNLNGFPNVTVVDSSGREVEGDVTYNGLNQLTLSFVNAFSGKAYLS
jgi:hypothetical protein